MPDKIGNPLTDAAQSGVLGRKPVGTSQAAAASTPAVTPEQVQPTPVQPAQKEQKASEGKAKTKVERRKKTILFLPEQGKWLDIQAATEGREQSEIVHDALELYKKLNKKEG